MKNVVITGATGMIGTNLIDLLLKKDIKILMIIRRDSNRKTSIPTHPNIKIIECNLDELEKLNIETSNYDTFFHLAWDGTFGDSRNDLYIQNMNLKYTLDAVNLASRLGCEMFIGAGSQAEYGRVSGIISPNTSANPENGYGIAKLCAGQMSRVFANNLNINHIWVRIFSIYGPYDNSKTMIMSSISQMLDNKSPDYTKAEQLWDYLYAEDAARALYLVAKKGKNNSIYCIGSGKTKPLHEYIKTIRDIINTDIKLNLGAIPYTEKQVMHLCADISNLTKDTRICP